MIFKVLTLFPEVFQGPLESSMVGLARQRELVTIEVTDIRSYTHDPHGTADDYQFGGGPGMVLKPDPIFEAVDDVLSAHSEEQRAGIPANVARVQASVDLMLWTLKPGACSQARGPRRGGRHGPRRVGGEVPQGVVRRRGGPSA